MYGLTHLLSVCLSEEVPKIFKNMDENEINGKISIKQMEISVERDNKKKSEMNRELQILNMRKQIIFFQNKITQIKNGF